MPKYLSRQSGRVGLLLVSAIAVAMLVASLTSSSARLVWNFTPSIPTGLYSLEDRAWRRGDRVALKPSGHFQELLRTQGVLKEGRFLMKRVAADEGDEVCRIGVRVTLNGEPTVHAQSGQQLPFWSGCRVLKAGEVFLLGESDNSFDGRYFGITSAKDIVGPLRSILTF